MRPEPAPSVDMAIGPSPSATETAAPPLDPPDVCSRFHGLRVMPCRRLSVSTLWPNSGVVVLANSTASAAFHWPMALASVVGTLSFMVREAKAVRRPLVRIRSLADTGTPASAPKVAPCLRRASSASAVRRAPSASSVAMGL